MADVIELSRVSLHSQVLARLRAMLVHGQIAPGAKLNERLLCDQLHISRTPLREAIKTLASEGLVDLLPNRGAVAVRLTREAIHDAFEVLIELEGLIGRLAAQRASDEEIREIKALHHEMLAGHLRGDLDVYFDLNAAIHLAINQAARNPVLAESHRAINTRIQSLRYRTNHDELKLARAIAEHQQMIDALEQRDSAALAAVMTLHLQHKQEAIFRMLDSAEQPQTGA